MEKLLTAKDIAPALGISRKTWWDWKRKGLTPKPIEINGNEYWTDSIITQWQSTQAYRYTHEQGHRQS